MEWMATTRRLDLSFAGVASSILGRSGVLGLTRTGMIWYVRRQQDVLLTVSPCAAIRTRNPAIAEGPRDAGVPVEIW